MDTGNMGLFEAIYWGPKAIRGPISPLNKKNIAFLQETYPFVNEAGFVSPVC
jgi:hypothetical protein